MSWNLSRGARTWAAASIFALGVMACDGDSDPMSPPPGATIQSVVVTAPADSILSGGTAQLTVTVTDSDNAVVANPTVTWSSSNDAIASVDSNGLVSGQAEGSATITATVSGVMGTASMSVFIGAFQPTANVTLSGDVEFTDVNVPAGVTVTVSDDLVLTARNDVMIEGDIVGDCVAIEIASAQDVTLTGSIDGGCSSGAPTGSSDGAVRILAGGTWTLDDADISSATGIMVSNRAVDLTAPSRSQGLLRAAASGVARAGDCVEKNSRLQGGFRSRDPSGGPDVIVFQDIALNCDGELFLQGGTITAASGEHGSDVSATASAVGGDGGNSGLLLFTGAHVTVWLQPLTIKGGDGGNGGFALVNGVSGGGGATATGGRGGEAWLPQFKATDPAGRVFVSADAQLTIEAGSPGNGGNAIAQGDDGADAAGSVAAENGGFANAAGGLGGNGAVGDENGMLSLDMFVGSSVQVISATLVNPQSLPNGGDAEAVGGIGGAGGADAPDGGAGGDMAALGGHSGFFGLSLPGAQDVSLVGTGGAALVKVGNGGAGFDGCTVGALRPGGNGGKGGSVGGGPGANGIPGPFTEKITVDKAGNGGPGGSGTVAGTGGAAGANNIFMPAANVDLTSGPNLTPGAPGGLCETAMATDISVKDDPAGHDPFVGMTAVHLLSIILASETVLQINGLLPWVALAGSLSPDLALALSGNGTVAGFNNVRVLLVGLLVVDQFSRVVGMNGVLTAGADGGLPGGVPITYDVDSMVPAGSPGLDPAAFGITLEQIEAGIAAGTIIRRTRTELP